MHNASSLMVGSVNMVLLLVLAVGVALLFKSGSRAVGVALLGILGALAAWNVLAVRSAPRVNWAYSGVNTYPDDPAADGILSASEATVAEVPLDVFDHPGDGVTLIPPIRDDAPALTDRRIQPLLTQFSPQHEIIRNQRLTMQMPGAVVHGRPSSGHWLETYPDGMQIEHVNRERRLVRDSDYDASSPQFGTTSTSHSEYKRIALFFPLGVIVLMLLAGFVVGAIARARRARNDDHAPRSGWGTALSGVGMIFLIVMGLFFFGYERGGHRTVVQGIETPVTNLFDAQQAAQRAAQEQVARAKAHAAAAQQLVDSVDQAQHAAAGQLATFIEHAPIEQLLAQMTAPRIMLTPPRSVSIKSDAHQELADAAKKILAATIPGADPFTQSWLINSAKTFITPVAQRTKPAGEARFSGLADAETTTEGPPQKKPDWLVNPPKLSGEVRRYVVSAGPYVTMAECEQAIAREMREVVQTRFRDTVANESGLAEGEWAYNPDISGVGISDAVILREFCADEYVEKVDASVGEMLKVHALLDFGPQEDALLIDYFKRWMRRGRLEDVVNVSALAVIGLAFVFGLLKVDTWTRGYYTKRLFIGVPAAIIAVGGIALLWAMQ